MDVKKMVDIRKQAEAAVGDMPDGALKTKSFEVILNKLLDEEVASGHRRADTRTSKPAPPPAEDNGQKSKVPESCPDRILVLREDGFLATARTLGEIRDELQLRGWIYPVTSLSGPLQRLVQKRELRRMPGGNDKNGAYTYVAP